MGERGGARGGQRREGIAPIFAGQAHYQGQLLVQQHVIGGGILAALICLLGFLSRSLVELEAAPLSVPGMRPQPTST